MLVHWCCLRKRDGELVDHLLNPCLVARELWSLLLLLFDVVRCSRLVCRAYCTFGGEFWLAKEKKWPGILILGDVKHLDRVE